MVALQSETYEVLESAGSIRVCAMLTNGHCSVAFPFAILFSTVDGSAGMDTVVGSNNYNIL